MLQQYYGNEAQFIPGPSEVVVFERPGETITFKLQNQLGNLTAIENPVVNGEWVLTPLNKMKVRNREMTFCTLLTVMVTHTGAQEECDHC